MLVAGAKRHAIEVLEIFHQHNELDGLCFFDDISVDIGDVLFGKFRIIRTLNEARKHFLNDPEFVLGLGNPRLRKLLAQKLISQGGKMVSVIAKSASLGHYDVQLGDGLNVMQNVLISNRVRIASGTLINAFVSVHHDVIIEEYCEISPHATLLGGCQIGTLTSIGSNATVLPDIKIGKNVIVGAGAVVTKDIPDGVVVTGIPARLINRLMNK